jgi:hypothetical protein
MTRRLKFSLGAGQGADDFWKWKSSFRLMNGQPKNSPIHKGTNVNRAASPLITATPQVITIASANESTTRRIVREALMGALPRLLQE